MAAAKLARKLQQRYVQCQTSQSASASQAGTPGSSSGVLTPANLFYDLQSSSMPSFTLALAATLPPDTPFSPSPSAYSGSNNVTNFAVTLSDCLASVSVVNKQQQNTLTTPPHSQDPSQLPTDI